MRAGLAVGLSLLAMGAAHAEEDAPARAERWAMLKGTLFGERAVVDESGVIGLEAPVRAQDAALVPITVTLPGTGGEMSGKVVAVWIVVDGNPSPVAGVFHFGPAIDPHVLKTRVRVDQYTNIHAIAETEDGRLFATARFVKAAGGCSAPSSKDPQAALARLGEIRLRRNTEAAPGDEQVITENLQISHPNNNGMQMDQVTHNYIPPRYIETITVQYGGTLVFKMDADISLSEDPVITFGLRPVGDGPLAVEVQDSSEAVFHAKFEMNKGS